MTVSLTWEDVKNTAIDNLEELEEFTPAQQELVLNATVRWIPEAKFLKDTFDARRYYAAHLAMMASGPGAGEGTQSSVSIDSFSSGVTLAVNNPTAKERLLSTTYGYHYWILEQKHFQAFFVG
jgi:hypothetical protein